MVELHDYLCKTTGSAEAEVPGIPASVMKQILASNAARDDSDNEEDWGDVNEAGW